MEKGRTLENQKIPSTCSDLSCFLLPSFVPDDFILYVRLCSFQFKVKFQQHKEFPSTSPRRPSQFVKRYTQKKKKKKKKSVKKKILPMPSPIKPIKDTHKKKKLIIKKKVKKIKDAIAKSKKSYT